MNLKYYISEIERFKELAVNLPEDIPAALQKKTELIIKAHKLLGDVAGEYARLNRVLHVERKKLYWDVYEKAAKPKAMYADRAVYNLEIAEAEAYGLARKYQNEFESIEEEIHVLKQKMKVNFADGSIGSRYGGT